jgi:transposase
LIFPYRDLHIEVTFYREDLFCPIMGMPKGMKIDHKELESRRLNALEFHKRGVWQSEISRRLSVSRQTVSRWILAYKSEGKKALVWNGKKGRPRKLAEPGIKRIEKALLLGPKAFGYKNDLWTLRRIGKLIKDRENITYDQATVWRLLKKMNWSPQRPAKKAIQRDETAIETWRKKRWPQVKKKPENSGPKYSSSMKVV